ncbi:DUF3794 domain-containing protein [Ruminococcaceae bacterium OttesenSCG-928-L11]|nr:DUF3794 domain-containing protein [Ruminococcaceae bacterium OttesenSCG-928-L11]
MELNLQRQSITISEVVYDGDVEQPIECDALLPDYCPDIVKVLKCAVTTNILSTSLSGDRLTIEGMAVAHVYYSSGGCAIRHTEYKIPFARAVDLREAPEFPVITVKPRVDYVNCRAVNQRRIDIRGALTLSVKVTNNRPEPVVSDAQGGGIQLRRDMVGATEIIRQTESPFTVQEELECGYGKPPIGNIVRTDARVNLSDHKIVSGKIVLKGEMAIHISYQPVESEELEVMDYSLPISQIVDCDGVTEDCRCDAKVFVHACDIMPKADEAGEYRLFSVDAQLKAAITAHMNQEIPVASDCYSTDYDCKGQIRPVSFMRLVDILKDSVLHKASMDLPEEVDSVLDSWCDVADIQWNMEGSDLSITVSILVSLFARMLDGESMYFEQPTAVTHKVTLPCDGQNIRFDPSCSIAGTDYALSGKEKIDIRCEVAVEGCVYQTIQHSAIGDIQIDESAPKLKEKNKLYLYYADEGESVWGIAKHYNTSANRIWEENALDNDILPEKKMILIPMA